MPFPSRTLRIVALLALASMSACSTASEDATTRTTNADPQPTHQPREWNAVWTARASGFPIAMAVDDRGVVTGGEEGGVAAIDPDGTLQWATFADGGGVEHSPALVADVVALATTTQVSALDRATGAARWAWPAREARVDAGRVPAGEAAVVLVGGADGALAMLDAGTGAAMWATSVPAPAPDVAPYVWLHGATAVAAWGTPGDCCHLIGLDSASGAMRWTAELAARSTVPIVHRGMVLVAQNPENDERNAEIVALDIATGRTAWRVESRGLFSPGLHGDADGSHVAFVDEAGAVTLVDTDSSSIRWRSRPVYPQPNAHPTIAGDRVFLTAFETQALGFDRRSGTLLGKGPLSPPVFVRQEIGNGDRLYMLVANRGLGAVWVLEQPTTASGV